MKIRYLPDGGFSKNGSFVEYDGDAPNGREPEYQRPGYLGINLTCDDFELRTGFGVINEYVETEKPDRTVKKWITTTGKIQPARWGNWTLSFLGHKKEHFEVSVSIHSDGYSEAVSFGGLNIEGDVDIESMDSFYIEIYLQASRFDELLSELSEPQATVDIYIRCERFENFYATWSPSISEGRIIKYLSSKNDVENVEEIPDEFWMPIEERKKLLSNPETPPVTFSVGRKTRTYSSSSKKDQSGSDSEKDESNE